jgi:hypothetical protein
MKIEFSHWIERLQTNTSKCISYQNPSLSRSKRRKSKILMILSKMELKLIRREISSLQSSNNKSQLKKIKKLNFKRTLMKTMRDLGKTMK